MRQPKVFLFDEPLSNLDAKMRVQTRTELIKLHQRLQATMIYVTHDQVEAMTMGSRIAVMQGGKLQQNEPPLTLYHEPKNLFVAGFLGSPPMNFVTGKLSQKDDRIIFKEMAGGVIECAFREKERPALKTYVGKEVILGVRPEDIELSQGAREPAEVSSRRWWTSSSRWVRRRISTCKRATTRSFAARRLSWTSAKWVIGSSSRSTSAKTHVFDPVTTNRIM